MAQRPKSQQLFERAKRSEPGGVANNARGHVWGFDPHPIWMSRGIGAYLEDVDGNRYTDYMAAWGPLILGHRPPKVLEAVHRTLDDIGPILGFSNELEIEAAEAAIDAVPAWEQVRFCNTGSDAVMCALRIARGYTGRTKVLRFEGHFHGWTDLINFSAKPDLNRAGADESPIAVPGSAGMAEVNAETLIVRQWNDAPVLKQAFAEFGSELAAVICEPIMAASSVIPPEPGYLELLRGLSTKHGVVLIFDEVKTGFRVAMGGAQELYGVIPDLSVAAKALGAGFPVAAVGGRKELFELVAKGTVGQGSTYQANPMVLAACIATLKELRQPGFFERLTRLGDELTTGLTAAASEAGIVGHARGVGSLLQFVFADHPVRNYRDFVRSTGSGDDYRYFWKEMLDRGVMFMPHPAQCWFVSGAHTEEDIAQTLEAAGEAMMKLASKQKSQAGAPLSRGE